MSKITTEKKTQAIKLYQAGYTFREAGEKLGISYESVRRIVREAGVAPRSRGGARVSNATPLRTRPRRSSPKKLAGPGRENACKHWTPEEDEILVDAVKSGMELGDAASLLGRTKIAVSSRKYRLIQEGIISEEMLRFPRPSGMEYEKGGTEVAAVLEVPSLEEPNPAGISEVSLQDLAQIVRDYGVSAQITLSSKGTEINITTA